MTNKIYNVVPSKKFYREFGKLSEEDKRKVLNTLDILAVTPFYSSLRTKKIQGIFESSVNMDIRIIWHFQGSRIIIALDVGHHDVIRKYNKRKLY